MDWLSQRAKGNQLKNINVISDAQVTYLSDLYTDTLIEIHYTRDNYGLRSAQAFNQAEKIDILTIGGSTTDQEYVTDGETWQDVLEDKFAESGKNVIIANAGVNGQSTFGHLKNFEVWFPQIPQLNPKYIFFYIGINDFYRLDEDSHYDKMSTDKSFNLWEIIPKMPDLGLVGQIKKSIQINSVFYNLTSSEN